MIIFYNRSPKIRTKNFKHYLSILLIVNYRNRLDVLPPLNREQVSKKEKLFSENLTQETFECMLCISVGSEILILENNSTLTFKLNSFLMLLLALTKHQARIVIIFNIYIFFDFDWMLCESFAYFTIKTH